MLATASNAVVLGFHVGKEQGVDSAARHEGIEIRLHDIIYQLIDQVTEAMLGLLAPEIRETVKGRALVKQIFPIGKLGLVAGCLVTKGVISPKFKVRVIREDENLFEGSIASLKHFQDEVAEVREAQECGVRIDRYNLIKEGDILEFYELEQVAQSL
jgi:translation initiation factor IF-2